MSELQNSESRQTLVRQWEIVVFNSTSSNNAIQFPCPRSLHAGCLWGDKLLVFGGYDGHSRLNDIYSYNFTSGRWNRLETRDGFQPTPRDRHSAVVYENYFIIFGGFDGLSNLRVNSLYQYDIRAFKWQEMLTTGTIPSPRHSHLSIVYQDAMYIFGGYDGNYCNDLTRLDLKTKVWSLVTTTGECPSGRYRNSCVVYRDVMIVHGGHDGSMHLPDTYIFNFSTSVWTQVIAAGVIPPPRDSHCAVVFNNIMYIFGGSNGRAMGDFHALDLSSFTWQSVSHSHSSMLPPYSAGTGALSSTSSSPSSGLNMNMNMSMSMLSMSMSMESRFCHIGVLYDECMYIFGGYDGSSRLNDLKRFRLSNQSEGIVIPPSSLQSDLRAFVNSDVLSDVTFLILGGNSSSSSSNSTLTNDTPRRVRAHKILCIRSPYFARMLTGDFLESKSSEIKLCDVEYNTFLLVLEHIYSDACDGVCIDNAMEVFQAADRFELIRLRSYCENTILNSISIETAASVLLAADTHHAENLKKKCMQFILKNFDEVSHTSAFEDMGRSNIELVFEILRGR